MHRVGQKLGGWKQRIIQSLRAFRRAGFGIRSLKVLGGQVARLHFWGGPDAGHLGFGKAYLFFNPKQGGTLSFFF